MSCVNSDNQSTHISRIRKKKARGERREAQITQSTHSSQLHEVTTFFPCNPNKLGRNSKLVVMTMILSHQVLFKSKRFKSASFCTIKWAVKLHHMRCAFPEKTTNFQKEKERIKSFNPLSLITKLQNVTIFPCNSNKLGRNSNLLVVIMTFSPSPVHVKKVRISEFTHNQMGCKTSPCAMCTLLIDCSEHLIHIMSLPCLS